MQQMEGKPDKNAKKQRTKTEGYILPLKKSCLGLRSSFSIVVGEHFSSLAMDLLDSPCLEGAALFSLKMLPALAFRQFCDIMMAVRSDCPPLINVVK